MKPAGAMLSNTSLLRQRHASVRDSKTLVATGTRLRQALLSHCDFPPLPPPFGTSLPATTLLTLYSLLSPLSSMTKCPAPTNTPVSRLLYFSHPLSNVTLMTRYYQDLHHTERNPRDVQECPYSVVFDAGLPPSIADKLGVISTTPV